MTRPRALIGWNRPNDCRMNSDLDDIRRSILDWIQDHSRQLDEMRERSAADRKAMYSAVTQLSNELFAFGSRLDGFIKRNEEAREKRQQWQDYKDLALGCIGVLTLVIGCSIISLLLYVLFNSRGAWS